MASLPTLPGPFTDNTAPTLGQLQQLSYAVSFIADATLRPTWHLFKTTTTALTASTWNTLSGGTVNAAYDNDGVFTSSTAFKATIVTQGYYAVEANLDLAATSTAMAFIPAFLFTAGPSNAHFTSGTTIYFGARGGDNVNDNTSDSATCIADLVPAVCYPGDTIQPVVYVTSAAAAIQFNTNGSFCKGRFVCNFTGYWAGQGT